MDRILSNAELWGFDINPHLKSIFPEKDNLHFISTTLEDLEGSFDLIIFSHSILYIPDLPDVMLSIEGLLKNNGILYLQIPDIRKNPYYSLMGDQSFLFTPTSLENVLSKYGFKTEAIVSNYFPRELLVAAKKEKSDDSHNYAEDSVFEKNVKLIKGVKEQLGNMDHQNLAVLGTTANAAFVDEIIGEKIRFFVDENVSKMRQNFRGKNVVHPKDLHESNHTLLPHWESGIKLKKRFELSYDGIFTVI